MREKVLLSQNDSKSHLFTKDTLQLTDCRWCAQYAHVYYTQMENRHTSNLISAQEHKYA